MIFSAEKEEKIKKRKEIVTSNRLQTITKRETSYEGLSEKFENGEDGIYAISTNDKNIIFRPKISITKKDLEEIPYLVQVKEAIEYWESVLKKSHGREAYIAKSAIIDLRKDQYIIKQAYLKPVVTTKITKTIYSPALEENVELDKNNFCIPSGVSLIDPKVCSHILCNYSALKQEAKDNFISELWAMMEEFDQIADAALKNEPVYEKIIERKIDGKLNIEIQREIEQDFGIRRSIEYISTIWRKKVPKMLASTAEDKYLSWYFLNIKKGEYKYCSRCQTVHLAHPKYFSRNSSSKDKLYSICKKCRNKKSKKKV